MENGHKSRGKNFTEQERQIFMKIFENYKHIFQDKRTDIYSRKIKNRTWQEITNKFNGIFNTNRTQIQMQFFYKNLKQRERQLTLSRKHKLNDTHTYDIEPNQLYEKNDEGFVKNENSSEHHFDYYEHSDHSDNQTDDTKANFDAESKVLDKVIVISPEPECNLRTESRLENNHTNDDDDDNYELQIRRKKLEMINIEANYKEKLYKLELEQALKKNKLLELEIAIKEKQLQILSVEK